jgi:hypothetical protein
MDKHHILNEIKRFAEENGGVPLGRARFQAETGIATSDWYGKYWARWGDAVQEAGFQPNTLQSAYDDDFLLERLARLVKQLGSFPVSAELRMKAKQDSSFPSHTTFGRLGKKAELAHMLISFCHDREGYSDVVEICKPIAAQLDENRQGPIEDSTTIAFVYLLKSGRYYKIGRTNAPGRREYEVALQLPEEANTVHTIRTDDPVGIEEYWHRRFAKKRKRGEWFELSAEDVAAFKRRKFM